jgi:hypothetical protein
MHAYIFISWVPASRNTFDPLEATLVISNSPFIIFGRFRCGWLLRMLTRWYLPTVVDCGHRASVTTNSIEKKLACYCSQSGINLYLKKKTIPSLSPSTGLIKQVISVCKLLFFGPPSPLPADSDWPNAVVPDRSAKAQKGRAGPRHCT